MQSARFDGRWVGVSAMRVRLTMITTVALCALAGCEPVLPSRVLDDAGVTGLLPSANPSDAGASDAGRADAGGDDAGPVILTRRDAGPVLTDAGVQWEWAGVSALVSRPPVDGGVRLRWVPVSPPAPDRAWAGGVLLRDGGVVAVPFSAPTVLFISPSDDRQERWPVEGGAVEEGWQGGVLLPDGTVLAVPRFAQRFLRIDPAVRTATLFGDDLSDVVTDAGLFRGAVLAQNGFVYATPAGAPFIARVDWRTGRITRLPLPPSRGEGQRHGAVLFPTGDIVMFPVGDAAGLLLVASREGRDDQVWLLPRPPTTGAANFTGGGLLTGVDTAFSPPQQNAMPVLYAQGLFNWGPPVDGYGPQTANAHFFGAWSSDGYMYLPPYGAPAALRCTAAGRCETLDAGPPSFRPVFGAVGLPDGRVLAMPHARSAWLEITPEAAVPVPLETRLSPFLNKL